MTRDKKYTIAKNHGEYCEGLYETRTQALQVWWSDVQSQFTPEEINEILQDAGTEGSPKLEDLYDDFFIDSTVVEVYI